MSNLFVPSTLSTPGRNNLLHPEDAERPMDPLPPPPRRLLSQRTMRPSSPVPLMKSEKLPQSLPPIGIRSTSPRLGRKRGENAQVQPPPSTAARFGLSRSHCQLSLISESEDELAEENTENLSVRGAISCPNSPLLGRRVQQQPASVITQSSFNRAFAYNTGRDFGGKADYLHSNNNTEKTDNNDQNNQTNTNNGRKFILPEIIVQ
ncbi:uncharacterized protein [Ptychodera flava]|uniref:uncharacterized protein n=1 Tax=Ptychodera flava TaxID=63121 RepID=UPI00396A9C81